MYIYIYTCIYIYIHIHIHNSLSCLNMIEQLMVSPIQLIAEIGLTDIKWVYWQHQWVESIQSKRRTSPVKKCVHDLQDAVKKLKLSKTCGAHESDLEPLSILNSNSILCDDIMGLWTDSCQRFRRLWTPRGPLCFVSTVPSL